MQATTHIPLIDIKKRDGPHAQSRLGDQLGRERGTTLTHTDNAYTVGFPARAEEALPPLVEEADAHPQAHRGESEEKKIRRQHQRRRHILNRSEIPGDQTKKN